MKRGQMQMQESIIVIFLVMILILIGMVFFYNSTFKGIENSANEYEEFRFRQLIEVIPNMAEFKCSHLMHEDECLDWLKLLAFNSSVSDYKLFKDKRISFTRSGMEYVIYSDFVSCSEQRVISSPVSLYDPSIKRNSVSELKVRWCLE
ncbi:hypothetical protein HOA59_02060 [archaeon]|jgi:hypothetical protein|nr:hypothetical protein [archaeon]MBT6824200.1 hypothetical protein [archaeon]MBT7106738.1 hypothetical protein [archaeon]MBT7297568.1 hypothetical protein [archaeon]